MKKWRISGQPGLQYEQRKGVEKGGEKEKERGRKEIKESRRKTNGGQERNT